MTKPTGLYKDVCIVRIACLMSVLVPAIPGGSLAADSPVVDIGSRLELFVDDYLIDRMEGLQQVLHHPVPREVVLVHDAPWEGSGCGYHSVFRDGSIYRMYYKAWHLDVQQGKLNTGAHPLYCCYAESDDGLHWRKPELGLIEFNGSKANNIVIASGTRGPLHVDAGHPAVFKDENPDAPADARYKAFLRSAKEHGLLPFKSADGIHWSPMSDGPVITKGAFDSQNLAFWDSTRREYRAYWRIFTAGVTDKDNWKPGGIRAIRTATSPDFLHWSDGVDLTYVDSPNEQLYTNQIKPYFRAPHIFIGFPTRYTERGPIKQFEDLPEYEHRRMRSSISPRYGTAVTDGLFMTSRDGRLFRRWGEAFLRPGLRTRDNWAYGDNYIAWHCVETKSSIPDAPNELSIYATESYWTGKGSALRRYTLRVDGFVSIHAPLRGGDLVTRPLVFRGDRLALNVSTSAAGSVRVEIQDANGKPIEGFALADCPEIFGDSLERRVRWNNAPDLSRLAGKPVRLRFVLKDADLYAMRFR